MSTRSTISILYKDGTVKSIYCHSDGYFSYNGVMLMQHYTDFNKVNDLIDLGDISSLAENVNPTGSHSFDDREAGIVVAYGRDRGEKGIEAAQHQNIEDFITEGNLQEYDYVFKEKNETWYLVKNKKLSKLLTLMKKDESVDAGDLQDIESIIEKKKLKKKLDKSLPVKSVTKETVKV